MKRAQDSIQQLAETSQWFHPYLVHETNEGTARSQHSNISSLSIHQEDSRNNIANIYQILETQYPKAGPRYWAARCWSLVYWQLVYLNLASVHRLNRPLETHSVIQHAKSSSVHGYHIDTSLIQRELPDISEEKLVSMSSADLRSNLEQLFEQCSLVFKFSHKKAFRLVSASLVNAIIQLFNKLNCNQIHNLKDISNEWLSGMSLYGEASLIINNDKTYTQRKACCMHYLIETNNCCSDCPRTRSQRLVRS